MQHESRTSSFGGADAGPPSPEADNGSDITSQHLSGSDIISQHQPSARPTGPSDNQTPSLRTENLSSAFPQSAVSSTLPEGGGGGVRGHSYCRLLLGLEVELV